VEAETVFVRDLGSRNGTLVNGQVVLAEHQLAHGDTVQIGPLVLEVFLDDVPVEGNESIEDTTVMNQDATAEQSVLADTSDQFKVNEQPIVVD
jgi:pSer/pThr/pTyr-binding forkhead associated (FHA) protein